MAAVGAGEEDGQTATAAVWEEGRMAAAAGAGKEVGWTAATVLGKKVWMAAASMGKGGGADGSSPAQGHPSLGPHRRRHGGFGWPAGGDHGGHDGDFG